MVSVTVPLKKLLLTPYEKTSPPSARKSSFIALALTNVNFLWNALLTKNAVMGVCVPPHVLTLFLLFVHVGIALQEPVMAALIFIGAASINSSIPQISHIKSIALPSLTHA